MTESLINLALNPNIKESQTYKKFLTSIANPEWIQCKTFDKNACPEGKTENDVHPEVVDTIITYALALKKMSGNDGVSSNIIENIDDAKIEALVGGVDGSEGNKIYIDNIASTKTISEDALKKLKEEKAGTGEDNTGEDNTGKDIDKIVKRIFDGSDSGLGLGSKPDGVLTKEEIKKLLKSGMGEEKVKKAHLLKTEDAFEIFPPKQYTTTNFTTDKRFEKAMAHNTKGDFGSALNTVITNDKTGSLKNDFEAKMESIYDRIDAVESLANSLWLGKSEEQKEDIVKVLKLYFGVKLTKQVTIMGSQYGGSYGRQMLYGGTFNNLPNNAKKFVKDIGIINESGFHANFINKVENAVVDAVKYAVALFEGAAVGDKKIYTKFYVINAIKNSMKFYLGSANATHGYTKKIFDKVYKNLDAVDENKIDTIIKPSNFYDTTVIICTKDNDGLWKKADKPYILDASKYRIQPAFDGPYLLFGLHNILPLQDKTNDIWLTDIQTGNAVKNEEKDHEKSVLNDIFMYVYNNPNDQIPEHIKAIMNKIHYEIIDGIYEDYLKKVNNATIIGFHINLQDMIKNRFYGYHKYGHHIAKDQYGTQKFSDYVLDNTATKVINFTDQNTWRYNDNKYQKKNAPWTDYSNGPKNGFKGELKYHSFEDGANNDSLTQPEKTVLQTNHDNFLRCISTGDALGVDRCNKKYFEDLKFKETQEEEVKKTHPVLLLKMLQKFGFKLVKEYGSFRVQTVSEWFKTTVIPKKENDVNKVYDTIYQLRTKQAGLLAYLNVVTQWINANKGLINQNVPTGMKVQQANKRGYLEGIPKFEKIPKTQKPFVDATQLKAQLLQTGMMKSLPMTKLNSGFHNLPFHSGIPPFFQSGGSMSSSIAKQSNQCTKVIGNAFKIMYKTLETHGKRLAASDQDKINQKIKNLGNINEELIKTIDRIEYINKIYSVYGSIAKSEAPEIINKDSLEKLVEDYDKLHRSIQSRAKNLGNVYLMLAKVAGQSGNLYPIKTPN